METLAFGLTALSAVVFVIVGILYNRHKKSMIVLFGIGFLLVDAAVCAFWLNKVQSDDSKRGQPAQDQQPISAANESKASEPLPKPSGETMPLRTPPVEAVPAPPPQSQLKPEDKNDKTRERDMAKKDKEKAPPSVSQTMTNSPGGIQAGRDVIVTHGPQPRMLTAEQTISSCENCESTPGKESKLSRLETRKLMTSHGSSLRLFSHLAGKSASAMQNK